MRQLAWLHREKIITLPEVSREELDDRSQGNNLAKRLACAQSAWFLIQAVARAVQHLPLTTLEVELLPFIAVTWMI